MEKSRVLLVGAGAIGTVCAYALEQGGKAEVTAVMRSTYEKTVRDGIDIDSEDFGNDIRSWRPTEIIQQVPHVLEQSAKPFDFVVVVTKNISEISPTVADIIAPAVIPGKTIIVLAQNGLNIEKPLIERFPINPLVSSIVFTGAAVLSSGKLQSDPDIQKIGPFYSPGVPTEVATRAAKYYISTYNPHGKLGIEFDPEVPACRWRKLCYNASFNAISTALQMDTSRMRMIQNITDSLVIPIVLEIKAAAAGKGIELQSDLVSAVVNQDRPLDFFKPSMLQDYEKGNMMEIETIVGEPLREGKAMGISMPTLQIIYNILQGLQAKVMEKRGLWEAKYDDHNPYK